MTDETTRAEAVTIPEGYALLPIKHTPAMGNAGAKAALRLRTVGNVWDAMVAAAPVALGVADASGFAAGIEAAAKLVEQNQETDSSAVGKHMTKRYPDNLAGLSYAAAIRALKPVEAGPAADITRIGLWNALRDRGMSDDVAIALIKAAADLSGPEEAASAPVVDHETESDVTQAPTAPAREVERERIARVIDPGIELDPQWGAVRKETALAKADAILSTIAPLVLAKDDANHAAVCDQLSLDVGIGHPESTLLSAAAESIRSKGSMELDANWSKTGRFELPLAMGPRLSGAAKERIQKMEELNTAGLVAACNFPVGGRFSYHDEEGEHDPEYVVMPDGAMLDVNGYADGDASIPTDCARAVFVVLACNVALSTVARAEAGE